VIDIKSIRKNPGEVKELCRRRGCAVDVDRLLQVDAQLRESIARLEILRQEQKVVKGQAVREQARQLREQASELQGRVAALEAERHELWSRLPNLLAPDTPEGESDADNVEISRWGELPQFDFEPAIHDRIGADLDILDLKRGGEVASAGFYYWKGAGAQLAWAIFTLAIEFLSQRGFIFMFTPVLAKEKTMFGTGYLPFSQDQIYRIEGDDLSLIGTSEQTLVGYHQNEILPAGELPLRYTAFSPCFGPRLDPTGARRAALFASTSSTKSNKSCSAGRKNRKPGTSSARTTSKNSCSCWRSPTGWCASAWAIWARPGTRSSTSKAGLPGSASTGRRTRTRICWISRPGGSASAAKKGTSPFTRIPSPPR
jgi:seryl-tRNA synthetase